MMRIKVNGRDREVIKGIILSIIHYTHLIEPVGVEDYIWSSEVAMVYLHEGDLLPYIEVMLKHDEIVSM